MKRGFNFFWRSLFITLAALLASAMAFPGPAHAYLDPGTGSLLFSAAISLAVTLVFMFKSFFHRISGAFYRLAGSAAPAGNQEALVFYSEGRAYWNTFKPVLEALEAAGEPAAYLCSSPDDPGLEQSFKHIKAQYIGSGNRAFAALNMLEAAVCVMTTPGLDVLQIRRSPGVPHYAHLVHTHTDAALYKLHSFDYFDSVLCSGPHQMRSLRHLESLRGTKPKMLLATGCPYMDVLADELEAAGSQAAEKNGPPRIMLAPTWGANGLLSRFGLDLLLPLAKAGYALTIRPHPQSRKVEQKLLAALAKGLAGYANVSWDEDLSPLPAMLASQVLVSDVSGIIFDYAFILERPVVTVNQEVDTRGTEAADIPWPAWELAVLPELGASIEAGNILSLPEIIKSLPGPEEFSARMGKLRAESLYNFRQSGQVAAKQILELRDLSSTGK